MSILGINYCTASLGLEVAARMSGDEVVTVTEGEILDAIHSPIPPVSVDGIKRRTGAGMGRCQGGFCGPRVVDLLARELGVSPLTILQDRDGSEILTAYTKGEVRA